MPFPYWVFLDFFFYRDIGFTTLTEFYMNVSRFGVVALMMTASDFQSINLYQTLEKIF